MRRILPVLLLTLGLFGFGNSVVHFVREPGVVAMSLQRGYGVQRDGKHELVFTSVATGKTLKTVKVLKGTVASEDKKYFNRLDAIEIPVSAGKVRITGRIFYCSFAQKFCSVQRVDEEI